MVIFVIVSLPSPLLPLYEGRAMSELLYLAISLAFSRVTHTRYTLNKYLPLNSSIEVFQTPFARLPLPSTVGKSLTSDG